MTCRYDESITLNNTVTFYKYDAFPMPSLKKKLVSDSKWADRIYDPALKEEIVAE